MRAAVRQLHARTALRRGLWLAGSAVATTAGAVVAPALGGVIGAAAITILLGNSLRPSSDFYLRMTRRGGADSRCVALTFDDGPDSTRTPEVLEALDQCEAKATFFMIGRRAVATPGIVRRVLDGGHEIGGHSYSHARTLPFGSAKRQRAEILEGNAALEQAGAPRIRWYRPPMGLTNPALSVALEGTGVRPVNWSLHSRDLGDPDEIRMTARILSRVKGGDIVLLHDGSDRHGAGPAAVPRAIAAIVQGLRARGLEPVTLSALTDGPR